MVEQGSLTAELAHAFLTDWDDRSTDPGTVYFSAPYMEVVGRRAGP